jgi:hypothetical protein
LHAVVTVDVAVAGAANQGSYAKRATDTVVANPHLSGLMTLLAAGMPTTNIDGRKVVDFDAAGAILDARALWIARNGGNEVAGTRAFEDSQGTWLPKRQGFEDLWINGRTFIYGALNPGHNGVGADYGPFCLVVDPSRAVGDHRGVFPGNTADRYGTASGAADAKAAHADAGCWHFAADVGVVEFGLAANGVAATQWPRLVCNDQNFVEVVIAGPIEFTDVTEVRVGYQTKKDLDTWSVQYRRGTLSDPAKRWAVEGWRIVKKWRSESPPIVTLSIV